MKRIIRLAAAAGVALACVSAQAGINTWTGTGVWTNGTKWSLGHAPTDGEDAVVDGTVTVSNSPARLASLTVNGARKITCQGWNTVITATVVKVVGTIEHSVNGATTTNALGQWSRDHRVWLFASNVTITGSINVDEKGWQGKNGNGCGTGRTTLDRGAAGHGGRGNTFTAGTYGGPTYGVSNAPVDPGSGGSGAYGTLGGHGGGAVRIDASGHVLVNGAISANGGRPTTGGGNDGGGSGGSIFISCRTFAGTNGILRANGGVGTHAGGGGGRLAIVCNSAAQSALPRPQVSLSVWRGTGGSASSPAESGSVFVSDLRLLPQTMRDTYGQFFLPSYTLDFLRLNMTNTWLLFPDGLPRVTIRVTNDLCMVGSKIDVFSYADTRTPMNLYVGGNLTLTNASALYLYAGATNASTPLYGGLLSVTGSVTLSTNCTIYPTCNATNGGPAFIQVSNLTLRMGARIDADARGYRKGFGPAAGKPAGTGRGGSGHGGSGGTAGGAETGGGTYGSSNAPVAAGCGSNHRAGGGAVWINARQQIAIDGSILARGQDGAHDNGAAAGGSVYLRCRTIRSSGTGQIRASGGNTDVTSGGGGGGRIAVYYRSDQMGTNKVTALGGVNATSSSRNGSRGTVRWVDTAASDPRLIVSGSPIKHGASSPYDYGNNAVEKGESVNLTVNSPADTAGGQRFVCLGWRWSNAVGVASSGTGTLASFTMTTNVWFTWRWTNQWYLDTSWGPNGRLAADRDGWYTNAVIVNVAPIASNTYSFLQWIGDCPYAQIGDDPLALRMDQRRTIQAQFASVTAGAKTWTGTGSWYGNPGNWSPSGIPGRYDSVTIDSGACALRDPATVAGLTVKGVLTATTDVNTVRLVVNSQAVVTGGTARIELRGATLRTTGNLTLLGGADLYAYCGASDLDGTNYAALVDVVGALTLGTNCWVYPYSHLTAGRSALFRAASVTVATPNAGFDADGKGYGGGQGPGAGVARGGAGHGGAGGTAGGTEYGGTTYGSADAPTTPGSGGLGQYGQPSGRGGGCIRIEASGTVTLNGDLRAKGDGGWHDRGGSAGGGIYVRCARFTGAETARVLAGGGDTSVTSGGGGGGRIAVWASRFGLSSNVASVVGGVHATLPARNGGVGTLVWGDTNPRGTMFVVR